MSNIVRSGVIPFTIKNNRLYFLLGIDNNTGEFTDFGGGLKKGEQAVDTAYREFNEESCNLFNNYVTKKDVNNSLYIINFKATIAIYFVKIDFFWLNNIEENFSIYQKNHRNIKKHNELKGIRWVNEVEFENIAFNYKCNYMWKKIQNIFINNTTTEKLYTNLFFRSELNETIKNSILNLLNTINTSFTTELTV